MTHKIQQLKPIGTPRPTTERTQHYECTACGMTYLGYPGQVQDWPEPGQGLPPCCGNQDCADYLNDLARMRAWVAHHGTTDYINPDKTVRLSLYDHDGLARRVAERRSMVEEDRRARGW